MYTIRASLDQVRRAAHVKHFSYRTEQAYLYWVERYIRFHGVRHPSIMGAPEIEAFLTHLAVEGRVAASTQNQALGALLFLYRDVLHQDRLGRTRATVVLDGNRIKVRPGLDLAAIAHTWD